MLCLLLPSSNMSLVDPQNRRLAVSADDSSWLRRHHAARQGGRSAHEGDVCLDVELQQRGSGATAHTVRAGVATAATAATAAAAAAAAAFDCAAVNVGTAVTDSMPDTAAARRRRSSSEGTSSIGWRCWSHGWAEG